MTRQLLAEVLDRILADEGGVSDHPDDRGGLTAFGLTKPFLRDVTGREWSDDDVRGLTRERALSVYVLWAQMKRLDQLPEDFLLAWTVIDMAVHSGARRAVEAIQRELGVTADGIAGPETQGAWHLLPEKHRKLVAAGVICRRLEYLGRFVQAEPSQRVFLVGWLKRISAQVRACAA